MNKRILLLSLLLLSTVACSNGGGGGDDPTSDGSISINGKTPKDYYAQFYAKTEGTCDTDLRFHFVSINDRTFHIDRNDVEYRLAGNLYLNTDHTYTFTYEEHKVAEYTSNGYKYNITYEEKIQGKWRIDGTALILENLGKASGITVNGYDQLSFEFTRDINLPGLDGMTTLSKYVSSGTGLEDIGELCGIED